MERRDFLKAMGIVLAGTAASSMIKPVAVHAKKRIRWRMVSSFPKSLDVIFGGGQIICDLVRQMTDGYFDIRIYAAGEIVPGLKVLDAVQRRYTVKYLGMERDVTGRRWLVFEIGCDLGVYAKLTSRRDKAELMVCYEFFTTSDVKVAAVNTAKLLIQEARKRGFRLVYATVEPAWTATFTR